jgi:Asp-tRNA(Asn)/Glu-tRNA(Gln) amidotransferase C subunit
LSSIDWQLHGQATNIGSTESEIKAIITDLEEAIQVHQDVLTCFAEDREPSDTMLDHATQLRGLAEHLHQHAEA